MVLLLTLNMWLAVWCSSSVTVIQIFDSDRCSPTDLFLGKVFLKFSVSSK